MLNEQFSLFKRETEPTDNKPSIGEIKDALYKAYGFIYKAAQILNVKYNVIYEQVSESDELKNYIKILKERNKEQIESVLQVKALKGNIPAIRNYLQFFEQNNSFINESDKDVTVTFELIENDK